MPETELARLLFYRAFCLDPDDPDREALIEDARRQLARQFPGS